MTSKHDRWLERWDAGETPWHQDGVHPQLQEYARDEWKRVLVPLCGATRDLAWLAQQGKEAVGVELSPIAARQLFEQEGLTPTSAHVGEFEVLRSGNVVVVVGDMFALSPEIVGTFDAVWDRAALVAVYPEDRERYFDALRRVAPDADVLLSVVSYQPGELDGPPFSIPSRFVATHYRDVEQLGDADSLEIVTRRLYRARL